MQDRTGAQDGLMSMTPALPLLLPPDRPPKGVLRAVGWRWKRGTQCTVLERRPEDDAQGAIVQWIVLRYYRDGVLRKDLAQEFGYCERHVQEYLSGTSRRCIWRQAYAMPVLRALRRLGVPVDGHANQRKRLEPQLAACRQALINVANLLAGDDRPAARRLRRDIAVLVLEVPHGH